MNKTLGAALALAALAPAALTMAGPAVADDAVHLSIKDHKYVPDRLEVPAGVKFKLLVKNEDPTPEEFESFELKREKVVAPGQEIQVFLGPLDPGEYKFFGDFHQDTAKGVMVAK
ncbi:hypothetical protein GCM10011611_05440 [Aliidongia dinghuensis]|uniref:EfeO-type cupredoxin-like domain-containing protein n=1 Tax=Aliidongia dinghuensis TaxID=1867774 RepID=A0A8J2YQ85_9PROT|nr:cupredoxin domain-containing protein [Aliidongia dinghuensis]GGF02848.1 hypothetical protein GCM10011611_05440 [Aliidongia dinghuensis]